MEAAHEILVLIALSRNERSGGSAPRGGTLIFLHTLMGNKELVALLSLSSWCLVMVMWLFLAVPWVCLRFAIVVFPDHIHLLFWTQHLLFTKTKLSGISAIPKKISDILATQTNIPFLYIDLKKRP